MSIASGPSIEQCVSMLRERLHERGLPVNDGVSLNELARFEGTLGLTIPRELRCYLQCMNGMRGHDEGHFSFWPLEQLRPVAGRYGAEVELAHMASSLVFADYMVSSIEYAVSWTPGEEERVAVYAIERPIVCKLSDSLAQFINLYLAEDSSLWDLG